MITGREVYAIGEAGNTTRGRRSHGRRPKPHNTVRHGAPAGGEEALSHTDRFG